MGAETRREILKLKTQENIFKKQKQKKNTLVELMGLKNSMNHAHYNFGAHCLDFV